MPKEGRRENHYRNRDERSNKVRHRPLSAPYLTTGFLQRNHSSGNHYLVTKQKIAFLEKL
jgi:hypothetical protein